MAKCKSIKDKGKTPFTKYFQSFKAGDSVAVVRELSEIFGYSKRLQGRTGKVIEKKGAAYDVEILDFNKPKRYFIKPVHLKKIEGAK